MTKFIQLMADFPEVQKKIQQEIDSVVAADEYVDEHHFDKLPYLAAAIKEAFRFRPVSNSLPPRWSIKPFSWEGFEFLQGTMLTPLYLSSYRGHGDTFNPDNMLEKPSLDIIGQTEPELMFFGQWACNRGEGARERGVPSMKLMIIILAVR